MLIMFNRINYMKVLRIFKLLLLLVISANSIVYGRGNKNEENEPKIIDVYSICQSGDSTIRIDDLPFPYPSELKLVVLTENFNGRNLYIKLGGDPGDVQVNREIYRLDEYFEQKVFADSMVIPYEIIQSTRLIKDINMSGGQSSYPQDLIPLSDRLLFVAELEDSYYYYNYWKGELNKGNSLKIMEGDDINTEEFYNCSGKDYLVTIDDEDYLSRKLIEVKEGEVNVVAEFLYDKETDDDPKWLAEFNLYEFDDKIYFQGYDKKHGHELWSFSEKEDPHLVNDLFEGKDGSFPSDFIALNNKLFFQIYQDGEKGDLCGLNKKGKVIYINKKNGFTNDFYVDAMIRFQDQIIFAADDSIEGKTVLWTFDGENNPIKLSEQFPDFKDVEFYGYEFVIWNNTLYFAAENNRYGCEIWAYDGTNAPYLIYNRFKDKNSYINSLTVYKNRLFFTAYEAIDGNGEIQREDDVLWSYDGYSAPYIIKKNNAFFHDVESLTIFNDTLFFAANDGVVGNELWYYTGEKEPSLLEDLNDGNRGSSYPKLHFTLNNDLYFFADNDTHFGLWKMDKEDSVSFVCEVNIGKSGDETPLIVYNNKAFFVASDSLHGKELWEFDGINLPHMLIDIYKGEGDSDPKDFAVYHDELYFSAYDPENGWQVWKYNFNDTPEIVDAFKGLQAFELFAFKDKIIFSGYTKEIGRELWQYDGNTIKLVAEIGKGSGRNGIPKDFMEFNGKVYFSAANIAAGIELWEYDGVNAPHLVKDILPGDADSKPVPQIVFQNKLYFTAEDENDYQQLWVYDGKNDPSLVSDLQLEDKIDPKPESFVVFEDKMFFAAKNERYKKVLWTYDGKSKPQPLITNRTENTIVHSRVSNLFVFNNRLYFSGNDGKYGVELWEYKSKFE